MVSGSLWTVSGPVALICTFLPGSEPVAVGWFLALIALVLAYGIGSIIG